MCLFIVFFINSISILITCLVLLNEQFGTVKHPDTNILIERAQKNYNKVVGSKDRQEALNKFTKT